MIRLIFTLLFLVCTNLHAKSVSISVGTYQDHQKAIQNALGDDPCPPIQKVTLGENQILAEYLIFCNALKHSTHTYQISLSIYPNNSRMLNDLEEGRIDGTAIGIWRNEARLEALDISPALFRKNEFVKGLYSTKAVLRKIHSFDQIKTAVFLTNQNWQHDWALLQCAGLQLLHVGYYEQMFNMIKLGRGDFVPITFGPKADLERNQFGIKLYPFPDYKLVFPDSSHFVINTSNQKGKQLLDDLQVGLAKLRDDGAIEDAYERIGIINNTVADWEPLRCNQNAAILDSVALVK